MLKLTGFAEGGSGTALNTGPKLTPLGDAATFNDHFGWETSTGLPTHIQDLVNTTVRDKPVYPEGANVPGTVTWQLDSGASITPHKGVITFSFLDSAHTTGMYNRPQEGFTEGYGYSPFTAAQRDAARIAISNWDDLIAPSFREVNGSGAADITMANTTTGPAQAWAYVPYDYADIYTSIYGNPAYNAFNRYDKFVSDVWIATPSVNGSNGQLDAGFYGLQTLNHELGHTLGLSHPGQYNYGDGSVPITYTKDAFYFQDSNQFTIMSYFDSYETGAQNIDYNFMRFMYPSTPMVDDVYVVQQKYGADMTTRTGDTTYGFNATADVTNEAMRFESGELATIFTIWDAKGNDTLDLSGYYTPSVIDLREGAYSSAGGWGSYNANLQSIDPASQKAAYLAAVDAYNAGEHLGARDTAYDLYFGGRAGVNEGIPWSTITNSGDAHYLMQQNIGIAYGAIIENAIGGHGDDRINGNQANNVFTGGDGADTFILARYSGTIPTPSNPAGKVVVDTSIDKITDFHSGQDHLDVSSFAGVTAANFASTVHYDAASHALTIDTDNNGSTDYTMIVLGSAPVQSDFIFHA